MDYASEVAELTTALPEKMEKLIDKAERGKLKIQFEHKGVEKIDRRIDITTDKLTVALIISALIIGSSVVVLSNTKGLSEIGKLGFVVAGILGFLLVIAALKSREF